MPSSKARTLTFDDNDALRELVGEFGTNLKIVSGAMAAQVVQRGDTVFVEGPDASRAEAVLMQLYRYVQQGNAVRPGDVLSGSVTVESVRPSQSKPDRGVMVSDVVIQNDSGVTVMTLQTTSFVMVRPALNEQR